jgi:histone acetyltransferase HTATIP
MIKKLSVRKIQKSNLKPKLDFLTFLVPAEIVSIREQNGVREFYIHYINYNRRLDEWVKIERMNLKELVPPSSSSSSSSSSNNLSQEISQSRTVPATTTTTASTSSETSAGNTTTFFLSDDAESLNNDLTQTATLSPLIDCLPTPTTIVPTKIRGNGNNHHSGVHSITKVKNIELIHLGRYFIKPWYFSPYPEVRRK